MQHSSTHTQQKRRGGGFGGRLVAFAGDLVCTRCKLVSVVGRLIGVRTSFLLAHFLYFNFYNKNTTDFILLLNL